MSQTNREGMTWEEWLAAVCFGSCLSNLSHVEKCLSLGEPKYDTLKKAWNEGEDPTEYAAKGVVG